MSHAAFRCKTLSYVSATTLLEVHFQHLHVQDTGQILRDDAKNDCAFVHHLFLMTLHSNHSSRMQGLLGMPSIIFITKVHKKQVPSSCS